MSKKKAKKSRTRKSYFNYDCLHFTQRAGSATAPKFCLFHAPVGEVLKWADVHRLEDAPTGAQRGLNDSKVRSVKRFLEDEENTIPTAVIIALDVENSAIKKKAGSNLSTLKIEKGCDPKPGVVIDGQHRLLGVEAFDANMELNVVALITDSEDETAFQFLVINNKAAKVATDHIKALLSERDDQELQERLRKARLSVSKRYGFVHIANSDSESPFADQVDWPINREGEKLVKPSAIETAIKDIQDRKVPEFDDEDVLVEFFFTMWNVISTEWEDIWHGESKLLNKVGIVCLTQYLTNSIVNSYDVGELDVTNIKEVDGRVRRLLKMQNKEVWNVEWSSTSYDTQAGRRLVVESLVQIARNVRQKIDWTEDVPILSD